MDETPTKSPELYERTHGPYGPGDFYVEEHECIQCGVPAYFAPDLIRARPEPDGSCYFYKQPETARELDQAIAASNGSCVCAVRYRGVNPEILVRIGYLSVDPAPEAPTPSLFFRIKRRLLRRV